MGFRHDALVERSVIVHRHISKLRVPFLITIIVLYGLQLITILLAVFLYTSQIFLVYGINALLLILFSAGCSCYYIIIAVKVLRKLKQSPIRDKKPIKKVFFVFLSHSFPIRECCTIESRLYFLFVKNDSQLIIQIFFFIVSQFTGLVIASAIGLFLFAIMTILGAIPSQDYPEAYVFWFCMLFISLNYIALTHVLSFHPPKTPTASHSNPSTKDVTSIKSKHANTASEDGKSISMEPQNHA